MTLERISSTTKPYCNESKGAEIKFTTLLLLSLVLAACSGKPYAVKRHKREGDPTPNKLYIVNHGRHTGVAILAAEIVDEWPGLTERFGHATYLEFGWGDEGFYQAKEITTGLVLRTIFWPTDTVMHVVSLPKTPPLYFTNSETLLVCLTDQAYQSLIEFVKRSFYRDESGSMVELARGTYGNSQFYKAVGQYYLMNTCNTWTAKGLQSAGVNISAAFKLTAGSVMNAIKTGNISDLAKDESSNLSVCTVMACQ